jgi:hypothetical protein
MDSLVKHMDGYSFSFAMDQMISRCLPFSQKAAGEPKRLCCFPT